MLRHVEVGAELGEGVAETGADHAGEGRFGEQEGVGGGLPESAAVGQAAAGDQAVDVRMEDQPLRPAMEHGEHAGGAAEPARIARQIDDRAGGELDQRAIAGLLMAAQNGPQLLGHGDGDVEVRHRQHLGAAPVEPGRGLRAVALRAGAVAAGMEDMHQAAAVGASPLLAAERRGPAGEDVGDGATMRGQHRRAMSLQVASGELAEDVRHFGHASQAVHHLVEQCSQRRLRRLRQVGVDRRRADAGVAEQDLDGADVDLVLEQPGRIGMAQCVGRRPASAGKLCRLDGSREAAGQDIDANRTAVPAIGEEPSPATVALRLPHAAKALVNRPRHRNEPLLVALADDPQQAAGLVDGADRKTGSLADPQAAGIDQAEAAAMNRVADGADNPLHLGMAERLRQPPLLGQPELFLNNAQSTPSVCR